MLCEKCCKMKTAITILKEYEKEIEKFFLLINQEELEKVIKRLENCNKEDIAELKAREILLTDYLYRNSKGLKK